MPVLHTPDEDLTFVREVLLPSSRVTVAEDQTGDIAAFIAVRGEWVDQLYVGPNLLDCGIGSALLSTALEDMKSAKLHCFQQNRGARRLYERHGFRAEGLFVR